MTHVHAHDAFIVPADFYVEPSALRAGGFTARESSDMRRHVGLAKDLVRCRYFAEEERSLKVSSEGWDMNLPGAGATRDMLGLLRQLFGDNERGSLASVVAILRSHADPTTASGQKLLSLLDTYEELRDRVLGSWDLHPRATDGEPLRAFLDWMYGEFLHSDAEKAERIEQLDTEFRLYEWQFHWIVERLAMLYTEFARIVRSALAAAEHVQPSTVRS